MVSISSKSKIVGRTKIFWEAEKIWEDYEPNKTISKIHLFLQEEYKLIPDKERIGKGSVYITKTVAIGAFSSLKDDIDVFDFIEKCFNFEDKYNDNHMKNLAMALMGELFSIDKNSLLKGLVLVKEWSNHEKWEIREMAGLPLRKGLKNFPSIILVTLKNWARSENPNLRRIVAESLRPLSDIKWLRDPEKNDQILEILTILKSDSSEYVRKSVGNNIKDLTKYMPDKILSLINKWILRSDIEVTVDLSSKTKKQLGKEEFYLIWTIKHALRWLKERNPEYYGKIEEILGRNYVLYYDEKRNKMALKK